MSVVVFFSLQQMPTSATMWTNWAAFILQAQGPTRQTTARCPCGTPVANLVQKPDPVLREDCCFYVILHIPFHSLSLLFQWPWTSRQTARTWMWTRASFWSTARAATSSNRPSWEKRPRSLTPSPWPEVTGWGTRRCMSWWGYRREDAFCLQLFAAAHSDDICPSLTRLYQASSSPKSTRRNPQSWTRWSKWKSMECRLMLQRKRPDLLITTVPFCFKLCKYSNFQSRCELFRPFI